MTMSAEYRRSEEGEEEIRDSDWPVEGTVFESLHKQSITWYDGIGCHHIRRYLPGATKSNTTLSRLVSSPQFKLQVSARSLSNAHLYRAGTVPNIIPPFLPGPYEHPQSSPALPAYTSFCGTFHRKEANVQHAYTPTPRTLPALYEDHAVSSTHLL